VPESASGGSATSTRERFAWPERISTVVLIGGAAMFCKAFGVFSSRGAAGLRLQFVCLKLAYHVFRTTRWVGTAVFVERFGK
jgi:hypothetical protein